MSGALHLEKPLCFFDLETTGIDIATDRIVEIFILKVLPVKSIASVASITHAAHIVDVKKNIPSLFDNTEDITNINATNIADSNAADTSTAPETNPTEEFYSLINPYIPIPQEASMIHGIYDKDVAGKPTFKELSASILEFIGDSDLAGYNSNGFDIPIFVEEMLRNGVDFDIKNRKCVDVMSIFKLMEARTLSAASKFYLQKEHTDAHSAKADVITTYEVLKAQIERYEGAPYIDRNGKETYPVKNSIAALDRFSNGNRKVDAAGRIGYGANGEEVFLFGKHIRKSVREVFRKIDPNYYDWMMNGSFPLSTKREITRIWQEAAETQKVRHKN
ncbi:MAG: 3'-5' exonuclease [Bacteroidales bacterium]|jgi:DNA polymerase-3 subunit epsilon|nr:3'-5' exonuclease [Bacteroidales bacterium]